MKEPENAKVTPSSGASGETGPGVIQFPKRPPQPSVIPGSDAEGGDSIERILALACRLLEASCCMFIAGEPASPLVRFYSAAMGCECGAASQAAWRRDRHPGLPFDAAKFLPSLLDELCAGDAGCLRRSAGTYLVHPVVVSDRPQGALALIFKKPKPVSDKEWAAAEAIAKMLSMTEPGSKPAGAKAAPNAAGPAPGKSPSAADPPSPAEPAWSPRCRLTPAEIRVAELIVREKSSKEIAAALDLSTRTVEVHRTNIRRKLGITHRSASLRGGLLASSALPTLPQID